MFTYLSVPQVFDHHVTGMTSVHLSLSEDKVLFVTQSVEGCPLSPGEVRL